MVVAIESFCGNVAPMLCLLRLKLMLYRSSPRVCSFSFVGNITDGRIVMLALHDAAGNYEHPKTILSLMAGHEFDTDFELRESFCLIGTPVKHEVSAE